MARFTIYSPTGTALYTGTPTFTGQYMKPGFLEFREVAIALLVELVPGCYVDYTRTGHRYKIYTAPQLKKQARSASYGGAFVYQSVQLYDSSKMLEYCPFRDLVMGDNRIHFSTQPSISTFEGCDGLASRFEACLVDQYGAGSWKVRIATAEENPALHDLMLEPRDFTVSGVNILECLDKIYEIWPEVGWVYKVEEVNGVMTDTIVIGGGGANPNVGTYAYGKGNGLTSITRTAANAEEIANRIFAYGSSRNMVLPSWYRNQDIKDAESVDIQNLMLPIGPVGTPNTPDYWPGWGETDGERDAAKAFVENAASILKNGLRPATVYFNGSGEYPEIYPSIRETTIGMVRTAIGDSTAKYYPSTTIYTDQDARIDKLLSAQSSFDSGLAGENGKSSTFTEYISVSGSATEPIEAGRQYYMLGIIGTIDDVPSVTFGPADEGIRNISMPVSINGYVQLNGITGATLEAHLHKGHPANAPIAKGQADLIPDPSNPNRYKFVPVSVTGTGVEITEGTYYIVANLSVYLTPSENELNLTYEYEGGVTVSLSYYRAKTFNITLRQVGFDIGERADLGNGKTIAMRTGDCAGRSFSIKSVQYDSANDAWALECWRTEDESLSQWFPNSQFKVRGLENAGQSNEYPGDEFVLLDIAMPDIYIGMASQKLLVAARELLADSAVERWQYNPEIDAKYMVENSRTINAGEAMTISDTDIIGESSESVIVDTITINEGESSIPTYKVTLRDRKKKTWTESAMPEASSSKSVGNTTTTVQPTSTGGGDSFFQLDESGNVTLKSQYQNLWVPGWLAAGGVGEGGGGGVSYLHELSDVYHGENSVLRADGTTPAQPGDSLVYDSTHGWVAAPGGSSVTVVDNLTSSSTTSALSANQGRTLKSFIDAGYVFKGFLHPEDDGTEVCDYPVCYLSGISGVYYGYGNLNVSLGSGELALIYRAKNSSTWRYKTTTISGSGGGGSYSAGTGISISNNVISLKTASTSQLGGVKVDGSTITINNGVISAVGGGGGGSGTVTSVGMSVPGGMSVTPSAVTTAGTFEVTWDSQTKNKVLASPSNGTGIPSFRSLVSADIPDLSGKYVTLDTTQSNISGAKTFTTNPVTIGSSSGIKVHASSYIDIGGARLVYDPGSNSLRVTRSSGSSTVNFYADGAVSAGAVGASSSSDIVFTDGDQTISGDKIFDDLLQVDGNLVVNNTSSFNDDVTIGSATMSWGSSRLNINKDTRFQYASGQYISISEIVSRLVNLGG